MELVTANTCLVYPLDTSAGQSGMPCRWFAGGMTTSMQSSDCEMYMLACYSKQIEHGDTLWSLWIA